MADIIQIKTRTRKLIRLCAGTITGHPDPREIGRFIYWLEYQAGDGTGGHAWEGNTHAEALAAAKEWQNDGFHLVDESQPEGADA